MCEKPNDERQAEVVEVDTTVEISKTVGGSKYPETILYRASSPTSSTVTKIYFTRSATGERVIRRAKENLLVRDIRFPNMRKASKSSVMTKDSEDKSVFVTAEDMFMHAIKYYGYAKTRQ